MKDTTIDILQKQREIIYKKSAEERFRAGAALIDFGKEIVETRILKQNKSISKNELRILVFQKYYSYLFKPQELQNIIQAMLKYNKKKFENRQ